MLTRQLQLAAVVCALALASLGCTALLHFRVYHTGSETFRFLSWNLLLAWIPLAFAVAAYELFLVRPFILGTTLFPLIGLWLVFLPNAPYLTTDLVHLGQWSGMPIWYDTVLLIAYAATGLLLGLVSLLIFHSLVARIAGDLPGWLFACGSLVLAAFGTYLGRFERWNSWQVMSQPWAVLADTWERFRHPLAHTHTYEFTFGYAAYLIGAYLVLFAFNRLAVRTLA